MGRAKAICEERAGKGNCWLYDDGGASKAPHCIPACQQRFNQWCWATTVASIASYWNPKKVRELDMYSATQFSFSVEEVLRGGQG